MTQNQIDQSIKIVQQNNPGSKRPRVASLTTEYLPVDVVEIDYVDADGGDDTEWVGLEGGQLVSLPYYSDLYSFIIRAWMKYTHDQDVLFKLRLQELEQEFELKKQASSRQTAFVGMQGAFLAVILAVVFLLIYRGNDAATKGVMSALGMCATYLWGSQASKNRK